jgi:hypothetical protein
MRGVARERERRDRPDDGTNVDGHELTARDREGRHVPKLHRIRHAKTRLGRDLSRRDEDELGAYDVEKRGIHQATSSSPSIASRHPPKE